MLILLDQSAPVPLRSFLKSHTVQTAAEHGWHQLENGELLSAAKNAGFHVFLTADKNIRYQQNLRDCKIAIVVLGSPQWPVLQRYADRVVAAVDAARPGTYVEVEVPAQ